MYRSPSSATTYVKVNSAINAGLTYTDATVSAGSSYAACSTALNWPASAVLVALVKVKVVVVTLVNGL